jgi:hypothetical protein
MAPGAASPTRAPAVACPRLTSQPWVSAGRAVVSLSLWLRKVGGTLYRYWSVHGRFVQAMETYARAQQLGVICEPVLEHLEAGMVDASRQYAQSLRDAEHLGCSTELQQLTVPPPDSTTKKAISEEKLPAR